MDKTYRQGEGTTHTFSGTGPTTRADGTPLAESEVASFNLYITDSTGAVEVINDVQLLDVIDDGVWEGTFTATVEVDAIAAGVYTYTTTTVGTSGKESTPSNAIRIEVLPPLAAPNPPIMTG